MNNVATNSLHSWILCSRPKTLGAITCPVLIGSARAFSEGVFHPRYFVLTLLCSVLLQILANVINDYGDFIKGSDTKQRLGPPRAMQMGWITASVMKRGIVVILLAACALGFFLVLRGGFVILLIGVLGIFLCGFYTLGRRPLAYIGFSEVIVFWIFGPLAVFFTYYVQTLTYAFDTLVLGIAPGLLSTALILTNNTRDLVEDKQNHKRTVAVRFGEEFARKSIAVLSVSACLMPVVLMSMFGYGPIILVACAPVILLVPQLRMVLHDEISARFNLMLAALGKSLYLMGILLSTGLVCGAP